MKRMNLKVFRIRQGLTQSEMAERVGYDRVSYALIEAGVRNPSVDFFTKLQAAFDVPNEKMWELTLLEKVK